MIAAGNLVDCALGLLAVGFQYAMMLVIPPSWQFVVMGILSLFMAWAVFRFPARLPAQGSPGPATGRPSLKVLLQRKIFYIGAPRSILPSGRAIYLQPCFYSGKIGGKQEAMKNISPFCCVPCAPWRASAPPRNPPPASRTSMSSSPLPRGTLNWPFTPPKRPSP